MSNPPFRANSFIEDPYSGSQFAFQTNPTSIKRRKQVKIKQTDVPGYSMPRLVASSGGVNEISFSSVLVANSESEDSRWLKRKMAFLSSLTYSRIVNEGLQRRAITPLFLVLGTLIELPIILRSVNETWGPFMDPELGALAVKFDLVCWELPDDDAFVDALSARQGRAFNRSLDVDVGGQIVFNFSEEDFGG